MKSLPNKKIHKNDFSSKKTVREVDKTDFVCYNI